MKFLGSFKQKFKKFKYFRLITGFILGGIVFLVLILGITWYNNKPVCDKCNVILVSIDTLSALHLSCYGYEKNTAPNLCAFADKNILFSNSYSQSSITLESHFSIFTSLYPHTHKMTKIFADPLNENYLTLAQLFKLNGYQTIYYGPINDPHLPLDCGIERGFNIINDGFDIDKWDEAYSKLIENAEQKKPTFLFLHTYSVHEPYLSNSKSKPLFTDLPGFSNMLMTWQEFSKFSPDLLPFAIDIINELNFDSYKEKDSLKRVAEKLKKPENIKEAEALFYTLPDFIIYSSYLARHLSKIDINDPKQVEYIKALYDEQIYNLDKKLSKLFALMEDPRLSKNTILIITADHGQEFMEHNDLFHANNLYRTSTQVPLIIHISGFKPTKITEIVQGIDIYPTAISLTGITPRSPLGGIDLSGLIIGKKFAQTNKYVRSELNTLVGIQDQNWRFYYDQRPLELYDLMVDPQEQNNVISLYPEKVNQFLKLLDSKKSSNF